MNTPHSDDSARTTPATPQAGEPLDLAQLLALARTRTFDGQRTAPERAQHSNEDGAAPMGDPYLRFTCADVACAAPLTLFREVLPTLPTTVALPFSPPWVLGLFALHTELIGLVDPAPHLFESPGLQGLSRARAHNGQVIVPGSRKAPGENWRLAEPGSGPTALIIGAGERMLALAVSGVGDLRYVQPEEIHPFDATAHAQPSRIPAGRFSLGMLAQPDGQAVAHIIKIDALLDSLLNALASVEETHG